jgi:hypothetical protein
LPDRVWSIRIRPMRFSRVASSARIWRSIPSRLSRTRRIAAHCSSSSVAVVDSAAMASACCLSWFLCAVASRAADMCLPVSSEAEPLRQLRLIKSISESAVDSSRAIEAFSSTPVIWLRAMSVARISTRLNAVAAITAINAKAAAWNSANPSSFLPTPGRIGKHFLLLSARVAVAPGWRLSG